VDRKDQIAKWYAVVPATFAAAAVAVAWLLVHSPAFGLALQYGFSLVCHQRGERSFLMLGGSVAVCARCLGIYLGAALGTLLRVPRELAWRLLLGAATTNALDWSAELAGLHGNWMLARFALGLTLGAAAAMLVTASIDEVTIPTQAKAT
jgi:uncharacterized membrane protein